MSGKRVAVVTGSNKGIGLGIVRELCGKFDGVVYLTSRDESRGKEAVESLRKSGLNPRFHELDIDDESSVIKLRDYIKSTYGGLDVLVNNAAIQFRSASVPDEHFAAQALMTLRTNYFNTERVCQILFPILKPHARVVNMSSARGHLSMINGEEPAATQLKAKLSSPSLSADGLRQLMQDFVNSAQRGDHLSRGWPNSAYSVSKVGISALTRIQQRELDKYSRPDVIVNSVHPGYVDTDMTNHKGVLTVEQGAAAPSWAALLPPDVKEPKGDYIWTDKTSIDWVNGPTPAAAR